MLRSMADLNTPSSAARTAVADRDERPSTELLVPLSPSGSRTPLYLLHGAGGGVLFATDFAAALCDRPVIGVRAMGARLGERPDTTIDAMVERYASAIIASHTGPLVLGGYSNSGVIVLEMTSLLRDAGIDVEHVLLFDSAPPGLDAPDRNLRLSHLASHLSNRGASALKPYAHTLLTRRLDAVLLGKYVEYPPPESEDHVDLYDFFETVAGQHELTTYDADVTLIRANDTWPMMPADYYWTRHLTRTFQTIDTPGDHLTMFSSEYEALAAAVDRALAPTETGVPA